MTPAQRRVLSGETSGGAPVISVLIPVKDRPDELRSAINSALSQGLPDLEVIVVDDGSSDDTTAITIARVGDPRVHLVRQASAGAAAARNRAATAARGLWLAPLDSDDIFLPGALLHLLSLTENHVAAVCGAVVQARSDGTQIVVAPSKCGPEFAGFTALFLAGSMLVRASAWHAVGGQLEGLSYGENSEFGMRLSHHAARHELKVVSTLQTVAQYRVPLSPRHDHLQRAQATELMLARDRELIRSNRPGHADLWAIAAVQYARAGHGGRAVAAQVRAIRIRPSLRHAGRLVVLLLPPARRRRYPALTGEYERGSSQRCVPF